MALFTKVKDVDVHVGDEVKVTTTYKDGEKLKKQIFAGIVIAIKNAGENKSFTVRKMSTSGVGIERIFPVSWPMLEQIQVVKSNAVRRAKLYYIRQHVGKGALET